MESDNKNKFWIKITNKPLDYRSIKMFQGLIDHWRTDDQMEDYVYSFFRNKDEFCIKSWATGWNDALILIRNAAHEAHVFSTQESKDEKP